MSRLERAAYLCMIAACLVSVFLLLEHRFYPQEVGEDSFVGNRAIVDGVAWDKARLNAVMYISTRCHFCMESTPFYRRLAQWKEQTKNSLSIIVVSLDTEEEMRSHLESQNIPVDKVIHSSKSPIGISNTPTILLVDSKGIVQKAFVGKLSSNRENRLMSLIKTGML